MLRLGVETVSSYIGKYLITLHSSISFVRVSQKGSYDYHQIQQCFRITIVTKSFVSHIFDINMNVNDIENVQKWGFNNECSLHWFNLTDVRAVLILNFDLMEILNQNLTFFFNLSHFQSWKNLVQICIMHHLNPQHQ